MSGGDWKAMFQAIETGDLELVRYYLRSGVDPNYQHPEYMALPLSESIRKSYDDISELLLRFGADPQIRELESGLTSYALAAQKENFKILQIMKRSLS